MVFLVFNDTINQPCAGSEETAEYKRKMFRKSRRAQSLCQELVMSKDNENIDMADPKEEKGIKRTSSDKRKPNKSKVSEKLISDDMDSSSINNYTPSTRSTRFPDQPSEEYTRKEVKITLKDYIQRRQKINTQEWVNSNDQKSWTTNLRQPNKILRL